MLGDVSVIIRVLEKLGIGFRLKFDPNNLLTITTGLHNHNPKTIPNPTNQTR